MVQILRLGFLLLTCIAITVLGYQALATVGQQQRTEQAPISEKALRVLLSSHKSDLQCVKAALSPKSSKNTVSLSVADIHNADRVCAQLEQVEL